jgi:hypothetical protein
LLGIGRGRGEGKGREGGWEDVGAEMGNGEDGEWRILLGVYKRWLVTILLVVASMGWERYSIEPCQLSTCDLVYLYS